MADTEAFKNHRDAIALAYENINRTNESVQGHLRIMTGAGLAFLTILGGIGAFLISSSVSDFKRELRDMVSLEVNRIVNASDGENAHLKTLLDKFDERFSELDSRAGSVEEDLATLQEFARLSQNQSRDFRFAYNEVGRIASDDQLKISKDSRQVALQGLRLLIDGALTANIDAGILYNASANASELGFDDEAQQLATLALYGYPNPIYEARALRHQHTLGLVYEVTGDKLTRLDELPANVRDGAWKRMLELVRSTPNNGIEFVLSEAFNVAIRRGDQRALISVIGELEQYRSSSQAHLPSYAHVIVAQLADLDGAPDLAPRKLEHIQKALCAINKETPSASWRGQSEVDLSELKGKDPTLVAVINEMMDNPC